MNKSIDLGHLAKNWPSSIVARREIRKFTGGTISPGTMANLDSRGKGPEGRFRVGRNTAYPIESLIKWLESRAS